MVPFGRITLGVTAGKEGSFPGPGESLKSVDRLPSDLRSEHGAAYLRLLGLLANCGLDAAGPPLLSHVIRS